MMATGSAVPRTLLRRRDTLAHLEQVDGPGFYSSHGGRVVLYENETKPEIEVGGMSIRILESCHSLWVFEPGGKRFRRVPRGTRLDMPSPASDWTPYHRLEVEPSSGAFAVALNEDGTRVLRSWLHSEPCRHCATDQTGEISVESIRPSA